MKVCELIAYARGVRPESPSHAFSDEVVLVWVNEIEGMVQSEILLTSPADLVTYTMNDLEAELLVPAPHSKIYRAYVCSMIDFARGEYSAYSNTYELFNEWWNEYAAWYALMYDPASGKGEIKGYYVSAYAIAVKHGYKGTEEEWLSELDLRVKSAEEHATNAAASAASAMIAVTNYPVIGDDGYWYVWDVILGEYVKTSVKAKGDSFRYEDFTAEQLESLKGKNGTDGSVWHFINQYIDGVPLKMVSDDAKDGDYCFHVTEGHVYYAENDKWKLIGNIKGKAGDDYVLTSDDKKEIASFVLSALPTYNGEVTEV